MTKTIGYVTAFALAAGTGYLLAPAAAQAAHAGAPYTNVDHSNDLGNDTGNSRVDSLNNSQLNENYHGPLQLRPATPPRPLDGDGASEWRATAAAPDADGPALDHAIPISAGDSAAGIRSGGAVRPGPSVSATQRTPARAATPAPRAHTARRGTRCSDTPASRRPRPGTPIT